MASAAFPYDRVSDMQPRREVIFLHYPLVDKIDSYLGADGALTGNGAFGASDCRTRPLENILGCGPGSDGLEFER